MDLSNFVNLGIGGFAILVMWWMYDSNQKERRAHFETFVASLTEREVALRSLEKEVRDKVMNQLNENTAALRSLVTGHPGK